MASLTTFSFSMQIQYSAYNESIRYNFSELVKYIKFQVVGVLNIYCLSQNRTFKLQLYRDDTLALWYG